MFGFALSVMVFLFWFFVFAIVISLVLPDKKVEEPENTEVVKPKLDFRR